MPEEKKNTEQDDKMAQQLMDEPKKQGVDPDDHENKAEAPKTDNDQSSPKNTQPNKVDKKSLANIEKQKQKTEKNEVEDTNKSKPAKSKSSQEQVSDSDQKINPDKDTQSDQDNEQIRSLARRIDLQFQEDSKVLFEFRLPRALYYLGVTLVIALVVAIFAYAILLA